MLTRTVLALLLAAPLSLATVGCTSNPFRPVTRINRQPDALSSSHTDRLLQLAQRYEQQGNYEGALRLYRQAEQAEPGNSRVESSIASLTARQNHPVDPSAERRLADAGGMAEGGQRGGQQDRPSARVNHASEHVTQTGSGVAPASFDAESRIPSTADAALPVVQPARSSEWMFSAAEAGTGRPQEAGDEASGDPVWWRATEAAETVDDNGPEANWTPKAWAASHDEGAHDLGGALELLQSHSVIDRKDGLAELARLGPAAAAAVPVVRSLTHDDDPYVQAHAAWALWTITREGFETVPALTSLLNSDEAGVVQVSAYMLGAIGPDAIGSVDALRAVCSTPELETRLHAAEALSRITPNSTDAVQILVSTLNSADPQSRWLAAISLAGVAPSHRGAAIAALTSALGDADDGVCSVAALTLGGFGPDARSAVPHLERAASSDVADVRVAAQAALACIDR